MYRCLHRLHHTSTFITNNAIKSSVSTHSNIWEKHSPKSVSLPWQYPAYSCMMHIWCIFHKPIICILTWHHHSDWSNEDKFHALNFHEFCALQHLCKISFHWLLTENIRKWKWVIIPFWILKVKFRQIYSINTNQNSR